MASQTNKRLLIGLVLILVGSLLLTSCKAPKQQINDTTYIVTFRDHDGTVLDKQTILSGQPANTPSSPNREGCVFVGWDKDYRCVTENMTITAQYARTASPTVVVVSMTAKPGQSIRVPVAVVNNPGVAGAKITMVYDPALTLKSSESGEAVAALDYTPPGKYISPCSFTWDSEKGMAESDGNMLWLTFEIPADAPAGKTYAVNCVCKEGNMYDEELNDVVFGAINGTITVE